MTVGNDALRRQTTSVVSLHQERRASDWDHFPRIVPGISGVVGGFSTRWPLSPVKTVGVIMRFEGSVRVARLVRGAPCRRVHRKFSFSFALAALFMYCSAGLSGCGGGSDYCTASYGVALRAGFEVTVGNDALRRQTNSVVALHQERRASDWDHFPRIVPGISGPESQCGARNSVALRVGKVVVPRAT